MVGCLEAIQVDLLADKMVDALVEKKESLMVELTDIHLV